MASAAVDLGDEGGWRTNEGEGWTAEEDSTLLAARAGGGISDFRGGVIFWGSWERTFWGMGK